MIQQNFVWWEEGEHRPKMVRLQQLEDALNVRFDLTERGSAKPVDGEKVSLSVDPEMMRVAVALGRLPKPQRDALKTLIFAGESKSLGITSQSGENLSEESDSGALKEFPVEDTIAVENSLTEVEEFNFVEKRKNNGRIRPEASTATIKSAGRRRAGKVS